MKKILLIVVLIFHSLNAQAANIDAPDITLNGSNITKYATITVGDTANFEAIADDLMKSQKRDYDFSWNYVDRRNGRYDQSHIRTDEKIYSVFKFNYVNMTYDHQFPSEGLFEIKVNGYRKSPSDGLQFTVKWIVTVNLPPKPDLDVTAFSLSRSSFIQRESGQIEIDYTVKNIDSGASSGIRNRFYLSSDTTITTDDTLLDMVADTDVY